MRRLLLFAQLLLLTIIVNATGQEGDIIFIDGARWTLLGRPVNADSTLYNNLKAVLPKERTISTANWDGYTAFWSIRQDALCLDSIHYSLYDKESKREWPESLPADAIARVFADYIDGTNIVASWLTREIRVGSGKVISYRHLAYERHYAEEQFINIDKGKVSDRKVFHNYVVEGFAFNNRKPGSDNELREKFPLHIENYPELADAKRIVFNIKKARVDSEGNLVECEVKVLGKEENPRLAEEMAELLKVYRPWRVSYINGEYRADGIEGWSFPYILQE